MADKKITELTPLSVATAADVFPIVEVSGPETKKITLADLMGSPGPIGAGVASTAVFTDATISVLTLDTGTFVTKFSIDGTLSSNSNDYVPTEKAVKTYVDNHAGTSDHNSLSGLQGGDSTSEYYHLKADVYNGLFSGSSIIGIGDEATTDLQVDYGTHAISATISGTQELAIDSNGLTLKSGTSVNNISTDGNLGASDDILVTQKAIKTYVDSAVIGGENVRRISSDSTAVVLDAILVDTTAGNVNIIIETSSDGRISIKKITSDSNTVIITPSSGTIDGNSQYIIDTPNQSYSFLIDEGDAFIF